MCLKNKFKELCNAPDNEQAIANSIDSFNKSLKFYVKKDTARQDVNKLYDIIKALGESLIMTSEAHKKTVNDALDGCSLALRAKVVGAEKANKPTATYLQQIELIHLIKKVLTKTISIKQKTTWERMTFQSGAELNPFIKLIQQHQVYEFELNQLTSYADSLPEGVSKKSDCNRLRQCVEAPIEDYLKTVFSHHVHDTPADNGLIQKKENSVTDNLVSSFNAVIPELEKHRTHPMLRFAAKFFLAGAAIVSLGTALRLKANQVESKTRQRTYFFDYTTSAGRAMAVKNSGECLVEKVKKLAPFQGDKAS